MFKGEITTLVQLKGCQLSMGRGNQNYVRGAKIENKTTRPLWFKVKLGHSGKPWINETLELLPGQHCYVHKGYFDGRHHSIAPVHYVHVHTSEEVSKTTPIKTINAYKKKERVCLKVYTLVEDTADSQEEGGSQVRIVERHMYKDERPEYYKFEDRVAPLFVEEHSKKWSFPPRFLLKIN